MATKHHLISRLTRIVELLQIHATSGLTFEELNEKLKSNYTDEDHSVSLRTFQRDLKDIESSLKIKIVFDKSKKKYVLHEDSLRNNAHQKQLFAIESLKLLNVAQDASSNDFILIDERKATGLENYNAIKEAITQQKELVFDYQKFDQYKPAVRKIIPLALKESKNRWYVVGYELQNGIKQNTLKTFALDRIYDARTGVVFKLKENVNLQNHFKNFMGVTTKAFPGFAKPVAIKIETSIEYGKYFSTLPLHSSQKIEIVNGKTIVSFRLIPTMEFVAELLTHNHQIKITEPQALIVEVKRILSQTLKQYT